MSGLVFFQLVPNASAPDGGRQNIFVIRESHSERNFMRIVLTSRLLIIEVMLKLPYSLLIKRKILIIVVLDIRNKVLLVSFLFYFQL